MIHIFRPEERIEIFTDGRVLQLDKGQTACVEAFLDAIASGNDY